MEEGKGKSAIKRLGKPFKSAKGEGGVEREITLGECLVFWLL